MRVQVIKEFLGIPVDTIGIVTTRDGVELIPIEPCVLLPEGKSIKQQIAHAMWIKFDCKDMAVGICEPFEMHVKEL